MPPLYKLVSRIPVRAHCGYCSQEITAAPGGLHDDPPLPRARLAPDARKIRPDHLVFFHSAEQALARGFEPAARTTPVP